MWKIGHIVHRAHCKQQFDNHTTTKCTQRRHEIIAKTQQNTKTMEKRAKKKKRNTKSKCIFFSPIQIYVLEFKTRFIMEQLMHLY